MLRGTSLTPDFLLDFWRCRNSRAAAGKTANLHVGVIISLRLSREVFIFKDLRFFSGVFYLAPPTTSFPLVFRYFRHNFDFLRSALAPCFTMLWACRDPPH
jgi:hypothetical protein